MEARPTECRGRHGRLGFGLVAREAAAARELHGLGLELERLGFAELWANDNRLRSGLATLMAAAGHDSRLDLGLGVAPLSDRSPAEIAAEVRGLRAPTERLILGVGTGSGSSLEAVRHGVAELRALLPTVRICVSALGPRMCQLGGEIADVVLLNWASPDRIAWARQRIAEGAARGGRRMPAVSGYVRVAIGPRAGDRLLAEADRYRHRPRPYRRLFAEQGADDGQVPGVAALDPAAVPALLAPYRSALDGCVVRALPHGDGTVELLEIARAAAGAA